MTTPLLTTKLYVPPSRPDLVSRPGLIERLNAGLHRSLTLISAPAGFGKTTLLSAWVQQTETNRQVAWLSLDEGDNDLSRFWTYMVAAIQTIDNDIGQSLLPVLHVLPPPPTETVLTLLINEIAVSPYQIIFILDDYHLIEAQPIHEALIFLLENKPPQMHLVIATREDPDLPLARLRARGQVTELRGADLRFTPSEAGEFLNQVMGLNLSTADITALETRTEGWVAGLQLAALSMQGRADTANFIHAFTGSHYFILDYLVEEVLGCQSEQVRSFLLQTSILERLRGPLCEAVTGQEDGQGMLEVLERANLFVIPLDDRRQWYRYHHLFADVLQARLLEQHSEQVARLHGRASEWYEHQAMPSAAIHHALAAEDFERAAGLAELAWPAWSGSYQSIAWLSWVEELPEEQVRSRPVLSVSFAWAYLNAGKLEAAEAKILDAERWLEMPIAERDRPPDPTTKMVVVDEEQFRALPITLAAAQAYYAQAIGNLSDTVKYTQRILDLLPDEDHPERGTATALQGLAYWASGDLESAHQTFSVGLARMEPQELIIGTFVLAEIKNTLGQLRAAIQTCDHALKLAAAHSEPFPLGTEDVYSGRSLLYREQGDLEAAAQDLRISKRLGDQVELPDWQYRWSIAQASLNEALGDLEGALKRLDEAERMYVRTPLPAVRPITAMKARVWVRQGRLTEALGWAFERDLSVDDELSFMREFEHITLTRLLIARYKRERVDSFIHEAIGLLERLLQTAEAGGRMRSMIEILVLLALADEARGDIPRALGALERALTLAEPEGYIQVFVDEGPSMGHLLYEALTRGIAPNYIQRLLAAFPATEPKHAASSPTQASQTELLEPLSERELEVLQLLAEGLTNQEIGAQLYLSPNTVKVHAHNIYGKLGVNNRAQAGARARALGILSST